MAREVPHELGFDGGWKELQSLVLRVDLTSPDTLRRFETWKEDDGTKEGLAELIDGRCEVKVGVRMYEGQSRPIPCTDEAEFVFDEPGIGTTRLCRRHLITYKRHRDGIVSPLDGDDSP